MTVEAALARYLREVTPTKRESTRICEYKKAQPLLRHLGKYSLASLSADVVVQYRDMRLVGDPDENGKPAICSRCHCNISAGNTSPASA